MARHDRAALPGPPRAVPLVPQAAPRATAPRPLSRALLRHGYWSRRAQRADRARQAAQLRRPATSAGCRTYRHCAEAAGEPAGCGSPMCSMQDRRARFSVMVSHSRVEREHHPPPSPSLQTRPPHADADNTVSTTQYGDNPTRYCLPAPGTGHDKVHRSPTGQSHTSTRAVPVICLPGPRPRALRTAASSAGTHRTHLPAKPM